jgi:hypothetical protein
MFSKKYLLLALFNIMMVTAVNQPTAKEEEKKPFCNDEQNCATNPDCECYCSHKCGGRAKEPGDSPVFVKNDPNGIGCYCKPWDRDQYTNRCKARMKKK